MAHRVHCFNPGPAQLPLPVLEEVQAELLDYKGTGMSVMELSHRAPEYAAIQAEAQKDFKELLGLGDNWHILFLPGGSSTQFFHLPYNVLNGNGKADYVNTGSWSKNAIKEAKRFGDIHVAHSAENAEGQFLYIPTQDQLNMRKDAKYLHITTNNTIAGTQWETFPQPPNGVWLVADMCSDLFWRKFDFERFGMFYASAQKNMGPSGVTVVAIRDEFLSLCSDDVPTMVSYKTQASKDSLYNTAPTFAIYVVGKVLKWLKGLGGLDAMEKLNRKKANLLYRALDSKPDYWVTSVRKDSRSTMNVVWRIRNDENLEKKFIGEAKAAGLIGLKGHRSVGGIRASIYNAVSMEGVEKLVNVMETFAKANP
ncbi:3-phosphoserine/phosphohydroxythreonine transaminase [bacterium]|nr:3-phosphoserine/phosphohydroxythreonine transaminase [candidate division CSSED10-310 bacterium]